MGRLAHFTSVLTGPHWSVGSDVLVRVDRLRDLAAPLQHVNDAAVVAQMRDSAGADVGAEITFTYFPASDGRYHGTVPSDLALTAGAQYTLTITITSGSLVELVEVTRVAKAEHRAA